MAERPGPTEDHEYRMTDDDLLVFIEDIINKNQAYLYLDQAHREYNERVGQPVMRVDENMVPHMRLVAVYTRLWEFLVAKQQGTVAPPSADQTSLEFLPPEPPPEDPDSGPEQSLIVNIFE